MFWQGILARERAYVVRLIVSDLKGKRAALAECRAVIGRQHAAVKGQTVLSAVQRGAGLVMQLGRKSIHHTGRNIRGIGQYHIKLPQ